MNGPKAMVWLLTSRCNLACGHCYAAKYMDRGELDEEQALKVVEDAAKAGVKHIGFTGGEVFLRRDALHLMEYASKAGISTSVVTNGSMLTTEVARELANLNILVYLSIDGANKETHEKVRGMGSWEHVISATETMRNVGLGFCTVMAVSNLNCGEVSDYLRLAKELGAQWGCLIPVMPSGRAGVEMVLQPREMLAVLQMVDRAADELDFSISFWCTPFAGLVVNSNRVSTGFCRTSSEDIDLDPAGNVLLCDVLDLVFSNVVETGILRGWVELESHPVVRAVTSPKLVEPCLSCRLRSKCRGGCFARSQLMAGDIHAPDPLCPQVAGELPRNWGSPSIKVSRSLASSPLYSGNVL